MSMNGIGPMVSAWVHARNAARHAAPVSTDAASGDAASSVAPAASGPSPAVDTVQFSPEALARFEAWKAKHGDAPASSGVTLPTPDAEQTCPAPASPQVA